MTTLLIHPRSKNQHQDIVLCPPALRLMKHLAGEFAPLVRFVLERRKETQAVIDAGTLPTFQAGIRDQVWKCQPIPSFLTGSRRRVELTGPANQKTIINGLNSGADVFMADLEDSLSPTWDNIMHGHMSITKAIARDIDFQDAESGKNYVLKDQTANLMVRPRGLHLVEKNVQFDGHPLPVPAAIFDLALIFFNCWEAGRVPDLYLPKIQDPIEAYLWNRMISAAEEWMDIPHGRVRVTVLIETFPAIFRTHEIVWELRDRIVALNCGRWDYLFSSVKTLKNHPTWVLPDRDLLTMEQSCMWAYADLVVQTCAARGIIPIGGMAAQVPLKDPEANAVALEKVRQDKRREFNQGFQGTWVAHPALVPIARAEMEPPPDFAGYPKSVRLKDVTEMELMAVPGGECTYSGLEKNVRVTCQYIESWLQGKGCVTIDGCMEDMATAEISRCQVWQWVKLGYFETSTVMDTVDLQPVSEEAKKVFVSVALSGVNSIPNSLPEFLSDLVETD